VIFGCSLGVRQLERHLARSGETTAH
jgi:hypothetical protein